MQGGFLEPSAPLLLPCGALLSAVARRERGAVLRAVPRLDELVASLEGGHACLPVSDFDEPNKERNLLRDQRVVLVSWAHLRESGGLQVNQCSSASWVR